MQVYQHADPTLLRERSHPWTVADSSAEHRYYDLREHPELIRTALEDLRDRGASPAIETFYRLIEAVNGPASSLESNDCALSGVSAQGCAHPTLRLECSGRLMLLFRELRANTSPARVAALTQAVARALSRLDNGFQHGAVGVSLVPVRFLALPGTPAHQRGQQLLLSFWAWGDDEAQTMANLDRTLGNLGRAVAAVSEA